MVKAASRKSALMADQAVVYPAIALSSPLMEQQTVRSASMFPKTVSITRTPLKVHSPPLSVAFTEPSTASAKPTCIATLPSSIFAATTASRLASTTQSAPTKPFVVSVESASPIGGLVKARTLKQKAKKIQARRRKRALQNSES
jgi:hypothetical protein